MRASAHKTEKMKEIIASLVKGEFKQSHKNRYISYESAREEIKEVIEWCDEKGHSEHEILDLIRRIVDAKPRNEEKPDK